MRDTITAIALVLCWSVGWTVPAAFAQAQTPEPFEGPPPQLWEEVQKLTASDAEAVDHFGFSVSIHENTVVVGVPSSDDAGSRSGSAYIFERGQGGSGVWNEVKKLTALDAAMSDEFGESVAIHGDIVVVGTPLDDDAGTESGSAYVFERNQGGMDNWGEVKKLTASDAVVGSRFGGSVAINGNTVVIGARGHFAIGSAYVFGRDEGGLDNWGEVARITASDGEENDVFGVSVSINADTVVVGAPGSAGSFSGSAYIFERDEGGLDAWGEVKKITASDAADSDFFGSSVSLSGDIIVVGASGNDDICPADPECNSGSAYVFERDHGGLDNWGEVKKLLASNAALGDEFGGSVAISGDIAVVGAHRHDGIGNDSGLFYVFDRKQGGADSWGEVDSVAASDVDHLDNFGIAVAISEEAIISGAYQDDDACPADQFCDSGSAYVFAPIVSTDLSIAKIDSVDPVVAGMPLTYTITVSNAGPSDAQDVVVIDTLPADVAFVSTSGCTEDPAGVPTCTLGSINSGANASYTVTVEVDPGAIGDLSNHACTSSATQDSDPSNDCTTELTGVVQETDLALSLSDSRDPVIVGETVTLTATATNLGPSDATEVVVSIILPPEFAFVGATPVDDCSEVAGAISCNVGALSRSAEAVFTVTATATTDGIFTTTSSVTGAEVDPEPGNNSGEEATRVLTPSEAVVFSDGFESGDTTGWTLTSP